MMRASVHEGWQVEAVGGPVPESLSGRLLPANVPGGTHLDLMAAGVIADPYLDRNEADLAWMHRVDWRYSTALQAAAPRPGERVELVFDGIDTVGTVELNGHILGHTANMHRGYRFDVRDVLREGRNDLAVTLSSALAHAEETEAAVGRRRRAYPHPYNAIRKMACSFGWDWGPDLQTAGLWKPVRLERWHTARLAQVRPLVTVQPDGTGTVEVHLDLERADNRTYTVVTTVDGRERRVLVAGGAATVTVTVPHARLWWPIGYGDQPLYDLTVALLADSGDPVDVVRRRVGFRTVTVDTEPDEIGTPFTFVVNGRRIFAKGANWIPDDHFLTRVTRERIARRVDQAVAANMNMLRIWGGGIYESDDFYDVCDERGILVWQDFPFACAFYAEEEPLHSEVEAEARHNVARLVAHPSLVLWNGNNENLPAYHDWNWQDDLEGRSWGLGYYTDLLPRIVAELDPTRPYAPGSPYSPGDLPPNDPDHGTRHEWDVWNVVDYPHYRDQIPRFCAEFGFQGPPTWTTLTRWVRDEPITSTAPGFLHHQKADDGNGKLHRGLAPHLPIPEDFEDWHWATQLNQARAVALGIEHFRSWWPRTAGALVWQLNDCWPVTSWSAVDSDERPKPLYYAVKHAFTPRLLTVQPRSGRPTLIAVNDRDEPWTGQILTTRQTFAGQILATDALTLSVAPRSTGQLDLPDDLLKPVDVSSEVLVVTTTDARIHHCFAEDRDLAYHPKPLTAAVDVVAGGYRVDVQARSYTRDIAILADRVAADAVVDDMLVSLAAGETASFHVRTATTLLHPETLLEPRVLRYANTIARS